MKKQTRVRVIALSVLVLALIFTGFASQDVYAACGMSSACQNYSSCPSCEHLCMPIDEACAGGMMGPNCQETVNRCYQCCVWY